MPSSLYAHLARRLLVGVLMLAAFAALVMAASARAASDTRPRVIATTDGEQDDLASMHRFIMYTDEFDVAGIVQSTSRFHHAGDASAVPPISSQSWLGSDWIYAMIRNYAKAYPKLVANDPSYPTPESLNSVVKVGNISDVGEFAKNTEGSDWIKKVLLDDDPRPVYISVWGGTNTVAAALRSIRDQYYGTPQWEAIYKKVSNKAWVLIDLDQDTTYKQYIATTWPDVNVVMNNNQYNAFAYGWNTAQPTELQPYYQAVFQDTKIRKGPVLSDYSLSGNRTAIAHDWYSEGDTPQFMQQFTVGLQDLSDYQPSWGSWGGRYTQLGPHLWADNPSYLGYPGTRTVDYSPYSSGSPFAPTALTQAAAAGAKSLRVAGVDNLAPRDVITVGTGASAEKAEIATVGRAQGPATTLSRAASGGDTNVKVANASGVSVGDPLVVDGETRTVTAVGTQSTNTTLTRDAAAGATNVKLAATSSLSAGDTLNVGGENVTISQVGNPSLNTTIAAASSTLSAGSTTIAAGATTLAADAASGDSTVKVGSVTNLFPNQSISVGGEPAVIQSVGTAGATGTGVTLAAPLSSAHASGAALAVVTAAGSADLKTAAVTNLLAGQQVQIDSGSAAEKATLANVGLGGSTTLGLPSSAGASNLKIPSTANFVAGTRIWVDAGSKLEHATITTAGRPYPPQGADMEGTRAAGASTLASDVAAGAKSLRVASTSGFLVGAPVTIDTGANAETVHLSLVGTAGTGGTGLDLVEPLTKPHPTGVQVSAAGLTLTSALSSAHDAGAAVSASGVTLASGLKNDHSGAVTVATLVPAGTKNLKVASMTGYAAGRTVAIDTGTNQETATIASVGTSGLGGSGITLTAPTTIDHAGPVAIVQTPAQPGATNLKLASVAGVAVGDQLVVDTGANAETVTVTAVGTAGSDGTGVDVTPALSKAHTGTVAVTDAGTGVTLSPALGAAHQSGAAVTDAGGGISFTPGLAQAHASGAAVRGLGDGITLKAPLGAAHAAGESLQDNMNRYYPQARWTPAIQNDFAARADWQLDDYAQANHPPVVSVAHKAMVVPPGQTVKLEGSATDPDGDALTYSWWQYREVGSYPGVVNLGGANTPAAQFTVPADAQPGQTIHLIFNVSDGGDTPMERYGRVVVTVGTPVSGTVGGTVPPTLSLTLGAPASFGAFTPGVAHAYDANMTANVTSTAGDATLSVSDPSSTATGHLVNGAYSLPVALQANAGSPAVPGGLLADVGGSANPTPLLSYSGPISNDPVAIGFRQTIRASDALRTGSYSKTLTFTLSTTAP